MRREKRCGGFESTKGAVLYFCLEDSYARIQNRLFQITENASSSLHFANFAGQIGGELEAQVKNFLSEHSDTNLIVIDTLQKVHSAAEEANPYASDYRDLSALKLEAVEDYLGGGGSLDTVCRKYRISSHAVLQQWIMLYHKGHRDFKTRRAQEESSMAEKRKLLSANLQPGKKVSGAGRSWPA